MFPILEIRTPESGFRNLDCGFSTKMAAILDLCLFTFAHQLLVEYHRNMTLFSVLQCKQKAEIKE
jgi:hypothetical protein